ncbi:hypothetical protein [Microbacterium sp. NPDC086615]
MDEENRALTDHWERELAGHRKYGGEVASMLIAGMDAHSIARFVLG